MPIRWTELYQAHFQRFFHKPLDIQVFRDAGGAALKLAVYDLPRQIDIRASLVVGATARLPESSALHGYRAYASMGMAESLYQAGASVVGEVILLAEVDDPLVPDLFVNALFFILRNRIPLDSRFAIAYGNESHPAARRFGKSALYVTRPFSTDHAFAEVRRADDVAKVFQAYFISPQEDEFLDKKGADAFEEKLFGQIDFKLSPEERAKLLVDKSRAEDLSARVAQLARLSALVLGLHRPSCV